MDGGRRESDDSLSTGRPASGSYDVSVSQPEHTPVKTWELNLFEGDGCLVTATNRREAPSFFGPLAIGQPFSVSLKLQGDWVIDGAFCQDVTLTDSFETLEFRVILINGDLNNDGRTNSQDALLVIQFIARLFPELPNELRADINQDGELDIRDAQLILEFDAGLIDSLPVGR